MQTLDALNGPAQDDDPFDDKDVRDEAARFEKTLDLLDYPPNEPAYVLEDNDAEWTRSLRINECLSRVPDISGAETREATEALIAFPGAKLRSWLPWIATKEWTGPLLLAFLAFRQAWDATSRWWEVTYWDSWLDSWRSTYNRSSFSLDSSYELVKARLGYPPDRMIDDAWHEDWEEHAAWRHGFPCFGDFARFRAVEGDAWYSRYREVRFDLEQPNLPDEGWGQTLETDSQWMIRHRVEKRKSAKEMLFDDPWAEAASQIEERAMREEDIE